MSSFSLRSLCGLLAFPVVGIPAKRTAARWYYLPLFISLFIISNSLQAQNYGRLVLRFNPVANNKKLVLSDSSYTNAFNETYQVSRLKFYISKVNLAGAKNIDYNKDVFLIDAQGSDSLEVDILPGSYSRLYFTAGVDSVLNVSGAQDGALDPLNGMFWTWNTGYIFFKMEGFSASSTADLNRIEQHIGGYRSPYNAARFIDLKLPATLNIDIGETKYIDVKVDLDKFFDGPHQLRIAGKPMLMSPGAEAMKAADNIAQLFSIEKIR